MTRREQILQRLETRTEIKDLGFVIGDKPQVLVSFGQAQILVVAEVVAMDV